MTKKTINYLQKTFRHHKSILPSSLFVIPEEINDELRKELLNCPEYENIRNIVYCIVKNISLPKCKKCGKVLKYHQFIHQREYCSNECKNSSEERTKKQKQTVLKRYGIDCILRKYPQNKTEEEKAETKLFKKRRNDIKRYGATDLSFKEKKKIAMLKKYGVVSMACLPEVRKKINDTLKEKFNGSPLKTKEIRDKIKETCLKKYGKNNALAVNFIRKKTRDSFIKNYFQQIKEKWKDYIIPLFTEDEYNGHKQEYRWKCVKCENEFTSHIYTTGHAFIDRYMPRCPICYPYVSGYSNLEKEVVNFVKSIYQGEIIENDRKTIKPLELDIVIPEKHLAIEFDGLFWHSEVNRTNQSYHLNKTKLCEDKGYQLIHIFEDEWINQRFIIEDRIKFLLGIYDRKIYARKCKLKEIGKTVSDMFLLENHLQGKDNASIRYGLYYDNELVSIMTFGKPRFNKKYDFELIRFASKLGVQVIGGFSKLFKHFQKNFSNVSIISYADRRYSKGDVYEKSGFTLTTISKPNYIWVNKEKVFTRYQCQKHKLKNILGEKFNPNLSESENMLLNGYSRVYDCGNLVFVKEKHN